VEDNGIGMSPEYLEKMYTPFTRATDSRVNTIQGTGLGLTITKRMVDLMGGTIECQSEVGKGTTFTVTIDLEISDKPEEEMVLPPIKVLIVDDDEILLKTAEDTLKSLGAETFIANSGKQALEMIKENKKDQYKVVILDWKMPDMNGVEVANKIKEVGGDIPIILISAYDWSEIEKEAKDAGIDGFIFKPLFRSKIYKKIVDLLSKDESKDAPVDEGEIFNDTIILVVEDNDINYEIISTLLGMHGILCERAENGKIAYEKIKDNGQDEPYDLIFMDIQMPVMNGLDATRAIRKLDFDYARNVPIIAMTADAFSENITECIQAGMNAHIAKPIDINLVLAEIRKIKKG
jgi:CheY-like chemotaxis protein